jgi:hypothetical protein
MTLSKLLDGFNSVIVLDTEFRSRSGEPNEPVCLCAHELRSGHRIELFFDRLHVNPFNDPNTVFVCYSAAAEWKTFLSLGWELPANILDLHFEYMNLINGVWEGDVPLRKMGTGLSDAMAGYGLDSLSHGEKDEERAYILGRSSYPSEGQRRILDYCWTDVDGTTELLTKMLPDIDLEQALLRGAYTTPVAWMEHNGLPISPDYREIEACRLDLRLEIAHEIEAAHGYGVYSFEGKAVIRPVFKQKQFDLLIGRIGLGDVWPRTPSGFCSTNDEDTFEPMSRLHPELRPLRLARKALKNLDLFGAAIGSDGRNRAHLWPFGAVTGRNNPKASEFILSRPHWVRHLIAPTQGRSLIYADIAAAEAGIAADASGDPELTRIYNSGLDPYLEFAKSAGALPSDSVRDRVGRPDIEQIRNLYKVADLAIKYGIGGAALSANLGIPEWQSDRIIASHKKTYGIYWAWADAQVKQAYCDGFISTSFGWKMAVDRTTRRNTILNYPQQAACAELLRLTLILAVERGLGSKLCAPHHDAFYLECLDGNADQVSETLRCCFDDAVGEVLSGGVKLRLEFGIVRYPDHYSDENGSEIWNIVQSFLQRRGSGKAPHSVSVIDSPSAEGRATSAAGGLKRQA